MLLAPAEYDNGTSRLQQSGAVRRIGWQARCQRSGAVAVGERGERNKPTVRKVLTVATKAGGWKKQVPRRGVLGMTAGGARNGPQVSPALRAGTRHQERRAGLSYRVREDEGKGAGCPSRDGGLRIFEMPTPQNTPPFTRRRMGHPGAPDPSFVRVSILVG